MSESYTFFSQDVNACNETEAWWNMINCIVNFVSASTNLATNLENNHVNVRSDNTFLERPRLFPENVRLLTSFPVNSSSQGMTETPTEKPEDMSLTDFPHFLDELAGKAKTSETASADNQSNPVNKSENPSVILPDEREQIQSESQTVVESPILSNTQEKGDCNSLQQLESDQIQDSDEGIEITSNITQEEVEAKPEIPNGAEQKPKNDIKTPSEDSCYFHEYSDSESLNSSDITNASYAQIKELENTLNPDEVKIQAQVDECSKVETPKGDLPSDPSVSKQNELPSTENPNVGEGLDIKKSQEIQTRSTSRFRKTVRALITQSAELQKPIKDDISTKTGSREKSLPIENATKAVPKNIYELKEQLESIKSRPQTAGSSAKKEARDSLTSEKQIADLTKCLKCFQARTKNEKKTSSVEQNLKAPRSSLINIKKEIIAEKTTKNSGSKKRPKVTRRYDSIESVVKRMILGMPKAAPQNDVETKQHTQQTTEDKQNVKKKQTPNSHEKKEELQSKRSIGNRPSSRSGVSRITPQKELSKEDDSDKTTILFKPKSKNVVKREALAAPQPAGVQRPHTPTKLKKYMSTPETKSKQLKQTVEEKKSLSASKPSTPKSKLKPKSTI